jgi:glycopeptide antibiotics resistance protein
MVEGAPRENSQGIRREAGFGPASIFLNMKWLTILFSLFIILVIVLADMGKLSILNMLTAHNLDKVGHFVLYGILTLLFDLTFLRARRDLDPNLLVFRVGSILALIIGVEEFSQRYFASRHSDIVDLTFSYLGIICFSWLALRIKR